jgi:membrane-associated protease RseP (regulator of RpoE activity)
MEARKRPRYWLHGLLLAATLATTTAIGARMQHDFRNNLPFMGLDEIFSAFSEAFQHPATLAAGLPFSLSLLAILMAHEMGHYLACLRYGLDASLPYFLPAPVLTGTFGAFIRIRSPIFSKRVLFDVAAAGPIAGFVFLIPILAIGLAFSKVIPGIVEESDVRFGTPAMLWLMQHAILPGKSPMDILLHPVARAAWVGLLATALNLIPIGQLDGGHILYSFTGRLHRFVTIGFLLLLLVAGRFFWYGWFLWAFLLFFARRHPSIYDETPLDPVRRRLGWLALAIFLLCFSIAPFESR